MPTCRQYPIHDLPHLKTFVDSRQADQTFSIMSENLGECLTNKKFWVFICLGQSVILVHRSDTREFELDLAE